MKRIPFLAAVLIAASTPVSAGVITRDPPRVLAHLCTWLGDHPDRPNWHHTSTRPIRGLYDSLDRNVLVAQLQQMRVAGLAPLVSWTGPESDSGDRFLDLLLSVPTRVPAAIIYEGHARLRIGRDGWVDFADPFNRERFAADMRHLYAKYLSRFPERFMREEGRFIIMLWPSHGYRGPFAPVGLEMMAEMPLYLVGTNLLLTKIGPEAAEVVPGLAAVSGYGIYLPEVADELGGTLNTSWLDRWQAMGALWDQWLAVNAPQVRIALPMQFAFDDTKVPGRNNPVLTTDYAAAKELVLRANGIMEDSQAKAGRYLPWATLASWNEYFEGTAVEPSDRYGTRLLGILREVFGPRHFPPDHRN